MRVPPDQSSTEPTTWRQRGIDVPLAQLARDARQPGAEDEDLGVFQTLPQRVHEAQQQPGVAVHRAGDVADDDERAGADLSFLAAQLERDAAVAQRAAQGGARIDELAVLGAYRGAASCGCRGAR